MTPIRIALITTLAVLTGVWVLAEVLAPGPYRSLHPLFTQYTGGMALAMMSLAMILATRPKWLERPLHGLDRMYRLHKWLGITGTIFLLVHWWWTPGQQLRLRKGWSDTVPEGLEAWLQGQESIAESVGEWTFYVILVLIALALLRWFPYHLFQKTHRLLAVAYLPIIYHGVVLMRFEYWLHPVGWITAALMIAGTGAAVIVLTGRVGRSRRFRGAIRSFTLYPRLHVLEGEVQLEPESGWPGHRPGQFAFVMDERHEGAHPFTIGSDWVPEEPRLVFFVKELGDYTHQLPRRLKQGMPVTVEGPYGCFDFSDTHPRQIWVAGGITPFVARMKYLAHHHDEQKPIDLFFATDEYDQDAADKLIADAETAGVRLHLYFTPRDGVITGATIRAVVPEWHSASVWFCGPTGFAKAVKRDLVRNGLPGADFHQELFRMR